MENENPIVDDLVQEPAQQGAQQPVPQRAPLVILLSPWDGDIDLSTKTGKSLWDEGIKPLENKFSGNGRDLARFLADVTNRAKKCKWLPLLTIRRKSLLSQYGEISMDDVLFEKSLRDHIVPTTLAEARPKVNALMMFHFLYDSLGANPQKKLSTKLGAMDQDGPLLLKTVLDQTFVATQASTFAIKERFYELSLKKYKWNVQALNQDVREKLADLIAAGHASDNTDTMISLFRAYKTATNEEFLHAVDYWKNEWNSGALYDVEQLMDKADKKYVEIRDLGSWGKRSDKDDQIIALTTQVEALKKGGNSKINLTGYNNSNRSQSRTTKGDKNDRKGPKWKYQRSASSSNELRKNGKTYHWCTGPGHGGIGMWVVHAPGKCDPENKTQGKTNGSTNNNNIPSYNSKQALMSILKQQGNLSEDEIESKVEAMLAVMES